VHVSRPACPAWVLLASLIAAQRHLMGDNVPFQRLEARVQRHPALSRAPTRPGLRRPRGCWASFICTPRSWQGVFLPCVSSGCPCSRRRRCTALPYPPCMSVWHTSSRSLAPPSPSSTKTTAARRQETRPSMVCSSDLYEHSTTSAAFQGHLEGGYKAGRGLPCTCPPGEKRALPCRRAGLHRPCRCCHRRARY